MKFYSTTNKDSRVTFEEAVMQGLAPDGGLFMPQSIDVLPEQFWKSFHAMDFRTMAFEVACHFLQGALPDDELQKIINQTFSFDSPLVEIEKDIHALELFHGPTMAFKDFGARFLAGVVSYYAAKQKREITILVATSGDTGSAVAHGFFDLPGTKVVVLYPSGKVSDFQEKQFTTLGGNVIALEVAGSFDDCQKMVKQAFGDKEIRNSRMLTAANSINMARLIPQMFYYFRAFQLLGSKTRQVVISVPSGNFGNLTAGLMAKKMGLPVDRFVAATNVNDVVPEYLIGGNFVPRPSQQTISNAMDVGNPSNFARMMDLYNHDRKVLKGDVAGYSFSDDETIRVMREINNKFGYILDPHGAVGYLGLKKYLSGKDAIGIFLETAHPAKFKETVERAIDHSLEIPERLLTFTKREKKSVRISNDFNELRKFLLKDF